MAKKFGSERPVIFIVDTEVQNLNTAQAMTEPFGEVLTFESPVKALAALGQKSPAVLVADSNLEDMSGIQFFEIATRMGLPSIRVLTMSGGDSTLALEAFRNQKIHNCILKPYEPFEVERVIESSIQTYNGRVKSESFHNDLIERNRVLEQLVGEMQSINKSEKVFREELEKWIPPFILKTLKGGRNRLNGEKDLVLIAFDIIDSHNIHNIKIRGTPARVHVIRLFNECLLRNGGWLESHAGDSGYGHFGLVDNIDDPFESALAAAREFRVAIRGMNDIFGLEVECGVALHFAPNCTLNTHEMALCRDRSAIAQKSFDTDSTEVDLLHEVEKTVHSLPGSNIVLTKQFMNGLRRERSHIVDIGSYTSKKLEKSIEIAILPSDRVKVEDIEKFKAKINGTVSTARILRIVS